MGRQKKVEIFTAGCPACNEAIEVINRIACSSSNVSVLDMNNEDVATMAKTLGIHSVPTVVIDGEIANCCSNNGIDEEMLKRVI